jgi:hypothetical protein
VRNALVAIVATLVAGCVLIVPDRGDLGLTCRFEGDTLTGCGRCIASRCQGQVNAVCADEASRDVLANLDLCSSGRGCHPLRLDVGAGGLPADLASCVATACDAECGDATPSSGADGGNNAVVTTDGGATGGIQCNTLGPSGCVCQSQASGAACGPNTLGVDPTSVHCCADSAWPARATACTCQWFGCSTSNGSCVCGNGLGTPGGQCDNGGSWACCKQTAGSTCVCSSVGCQTGFEPMGSRCSSVFDIHCAPNQKEVTSCGN